MALATKYLRKRGVNIRRRNQRATTSSIDNFDVTKQSLHPSKATKKRLIKPMPEHNSNSIDEERIQDIYLFPESTPEQHLKFKRML